MPLRLFPARAARQLPVRRRALLSSSSQRAELESIRRALATLALLWPATRFTLIDTTGNARPRSERELEAAREKTLLRAAKVRVRPPPGWWASLTTSHPRSDLLRAFL